MKIRTIIGVVITLFLIGSALYASFCIQDGFFSLKLNEQGDFLAGYIAPLALVWLVVGYLQQGEELEENTKALVAQKEEFEEQNKSIKKQLFENTFFNLLNLHNEITNSIKFETRQGLLEGRDAIIQILLIFIIKLQRIDKPLSMEDSIFSDEEGYNKIEDAQNHYSVSNNLDPIKVREEYNLFYELYQNNIGHYFRNLYLILKFVENSGFKKDDKKFYSNFLRAQLSSDELLFLFYNCSSKLGEDKFKPLIEEYEFFEHLPKYACLDKLENVFIKKTFGESPEWK